MTHPEQPQQTQGEVPFEHFRRDAPWHRNLSGGSK